MNKILYIICSVVLAISMSIICLYTMIWPQIIVITITMIGIYISAYCTGFLTIHSNYILVAKDLANTAQFWRNQYLKIEKKIIEIKKIDIKMFKAYDTIVLEAFKRKVFTNEEWCELDKKMNEARALFLGSIMLEELEHD